MSEKKSEDKQPGVDKFGFKEESKQSSLPINSPDKIKRDNARIEKWRQMMPKMQQLLLKKDKKLKERIRKGIPDSYRGKIWPMIANVDMLKARSELHFEDLIKEQDVPYMDDIKKDVNRTFPDNTFFAEKDGNGQKALTRVLQALSLTYKDMGYCQGLNYVCALLVLYCNDEEAYWMMNSLMNNYKLVDYYRDLECVKKPLFVLDELVKSHFPKLSAHLKAQYIEALLYATSWFMTLYTNTLPFKLVVRLFDSFLNEKFKILYRIALAIFKIKEKSLMECKTMDKIMENLKSFKEPEFQDDDVFITIAFKIYLSRKEIDKIEARYGLPEPTPTSKK